jgi:hypothetical protein
MDTKLVFVLATLHLVCENPNKSRSSVYSCLHSLVTNRPGPNIHHELICCKNQSTLQARVPYSRTHNDYPEGDNLAQQKFNGFLLSCQLFRIVIGPRVIGSGLSWDNCFVEFNLLRGICFPFISSELI